MRVVIRLLDCSVGSNEHRRALPHLLGASGLLVVPRECPDAEPDGCQQDGDDDSVRHCEILTGLGLRP
jgi:hypothetical protein